MSRETCIINTGVANTASVVAALKRIGLEPYLSVKESDVKEAPYAVLPGVGSFDAGISQLKELGLVEAIKQRIYEDRPTLCICLGMQMLASSSEEASAENGLGIFDLPVTRFKSSVSIPQFGWNKITVSSNSRFLESGYAYFANSYCLKETPKDWQSATSFHGETFVAACEKGNVLACQFHPELSGELGENILKRWAA